MTHIGQKVRFGTVGIFRSYLAVFELSDIFETDQDTVALCRFCHDWRAVDLESDFGIDTGRIGDQQRHHAIHDLFAGGTADLPGKRLQRPAL